MVAYSDISYASGVAEMLKLARLRPDLASLSTTQALYNLPTVGTCSNADGSRSACQNYVLEITNRSSIAGDPERPEVLISGALHGDERIGPATALALARLLVEQYDTDPWARRLVDERTVLIMPMTNALGVESRRRDENGIDPNRDFPYDQSPTNCMQTIAARSINELYRARLLQLVITFHGGMQAIGYNWGAFNYYTGSPRRSPDDVSQREISAQMSRFAGTGGSRTRNRNYPAATMNDLVYPVHGGMEDWGYAASWDRGFVKPCTPRTFGGYPSAKTSYDDASARAFTVLVETSDVKGPSANTYGAEAGVYAPGGSGDGHVPRNVRLALAAIDLVRPSIVAWRGESGERGPGRSGTATVKAGACVALTWVAWGTVHVEATSPVCRRSSRDEWAACGETQAGDGVWGGTSTPLAPHKFHGCARVPADASGAFEVGVRVTADTAWSREPQQAYAPKKPPQSHLALSRQEGYVMGHNGRRVRGYSQWYSAPILLRVARRPARNWPRLLRSSETRRGQYI